jgi:hypothetical protein
MACVSAPALWPQVKVNPEHEAVFRYAGYELGNEVCELDEKRMQA